MSELSIKRIHQVTALIFAVSVLFYLFFQVNKRNPFVEANPFANDPYDAVGSIAIQLAFLIALLSYARVIRWRNDPSQAKEKLILHGNILVLAAIFITLCSDAMAEFIQPTSSSLLSFVLRIELGLMFILTVVCALALWMVFRGLTTPIPPTDLTPADAIDDLWSLVRVPVARSNSFFPPAMVEWVNCFTSDLLFARLHGSTRACIPGDFTLAVGLLVGLLPSNRPASRRSATQPWHRFTAGRNFHLGRARHHINRIRHLWGIFGFETVPVK